MRFIRKSNYSVFEICKNIIYVIYTKMLYPGARIVRFPFVLRGKKYIDLGQGFSCGKNCRIEVNGLHNQKVIVFGDRVIIGDNVRISAIENVQIGSGVLMGSKVLIIDNSHGSYSGIEQDSPYGEPNARSLSSKPVRIEKNVWIGEGSVIQMGVTIGEGSIIAANSVVTKSVPAHTISGGVPACPLKKYNSKSMMWERIRK